MKKCSFCKSRTHLNYGYIAGCLPHPKTEKIIDKWGRADWWINLEREDLTEEESKELDNLSFYDQMLHSVGRGYQCDDCLKKEDELLNKYYPEPLLTNETTYDTK